VGAATRLQLRVYPLAQGTGACHDPEVLAEKAPTVLIVDDHAGFRSIARTVLEADGFRVVGEAEDGRSALASIPAIRPDLVLLDVQLPDFDGFEVLRRLAAAGEAPQVVLISSHEASVYGPRVHDSGASGFLHKPDLSGQALRALVEGIT
jgi:DNA-binding NarL/FixJ family response regulator